MKIVGHRNVLSLPTPQEARRRALRLQEHVDRLNPYPKPRGFVFRTRTREVYEARRRRQENPRLW